MNTTDMARNMSNQQEANFIESIATPKNGEREISRRIVWTVLVIVLSCTIIGALFGSYLTMTLMNCDQNCTHKSDDTGTEIAMDNANSIIDTTDSLRIVSRSEWVAQPPEAELLPLKLPSTRVIIAHTATEHCKTQAECTFQVRLIQTFHIESRGWDDIAYNFLVGGDGAAYAGRGWDIQGAHTRGYNARSICITFIGTFNKIAPPKRQLEAAQKLLEEGIRLKKLSEDYALYGHRQLIASESPGLALYEIVKQWDHWSENVES